MFHHSSLLHQPLLSSDSSSDETTIAISTIKKEHIIFPSFAALIKSIVPGISATLLFEDLRYQSQDEKKEDEDENTRFSLPTPSTTQTPSSFTRSQVQALKEPLFPTGHLQDKSSSPKSTVTPLGNPYACSTDEDNHQAILDRYQQRYGQFVGALQFLVKKLKQFQQTSVLATSEEEKATPPKPLQQLANIQTLINNRQKSEEDIKSALAPLSLDELYQLSHDNVLLQFSFQNITLQNNASLKEKLEIWEHELVRRAKIIKAITKAIHKKIYSSSQVTILSPRQLLVLFLIEQRQASLQDNKLFIQTSTVFKTQLIPDTDSVQVKEEITTTETSKLLYGLGKESRQEYLSLYALWLEKAPSQDPLSFHQRFLGFQHAISNQKVATWFAIKPDFDQELIMHHLCIAFSDSKLKNLTAKEVKELQDSNKHSPAVSQCFSYLDKYFGHTTANKRDEVSTGANYWGRLIQVARGDKTVLTFKASRMANPSGELAYMNLQDDQDSVIALAKKRLIPWIEAVILDQIHEYRTLWDSSASHHISQDPIPVNIHFQSLLSPLIVDNRTIKSDNNSRMIEISRRALLEIYMERFAGKIISVAGVQYAVNLLNTNYAVNNLRDSPVLDKGLATMPCEQRMLIDRTLAFIDRVSHVSDGILDTALLQLLQHIASDTPGYRLSDLKNNPREKRQLLIQYKKTADSKITRLLQQGKTDQEVKLRLAILQGYLCEYVLALTQGRHHSKQFNTNLHLASIESIITNYSCGHTSGPCKSGLDRKGKEALNTAVLLSFTVITGKVFSITSPPNDFFLFATIYQNLFDNQEQPSHITCLRNMGSPGSFGLKRVADITHPFVISFFHLVFTANFLALEKKLSDLTKLPGVGSISKRTGALTSLHRKTDIPGHVQALSVDSTHSKPNTPTTSEKTSCWTYFLLSCCCCCAPRLLPHKPFAYAHQLSIRQFATASHRIKETFRDHPLLAKQAFTLLTYFSEIPGLYDSLIQASLSDNQHFSALSYTKSKPLRIWAESFKKIFPDLARKTYQDNIAAMIDSILPEDAPAKQRTNFKAIMASYDYYFVPTCSCEFFTSCYNGSLKTIIRHNPWETLSFSAMLFSLCVVWVACDHYCNKDDTGILTLMNQVLFNAFGIGAGLRALYLGWQLNHNLAHYQDMVADIQQTEQQRTLQLF